VEFKEPEVVNGDGFVEGEKGNWAGVGAAGPLLPKPDNVSCCGDDSVNGFATLYFLATLAINSFSRP
jgi:hypothetical protein